MAPPHNNRLHLSLPLSLSTKHHHRRCSKAQMCFFNILHIISTFPAADVTHNKFLTHDDDIFENKGFVFDAVGENCVFVKNDQVKRESESESAVEDERGTEHSEISHVGDQSSGIAIDYNGALSEQVIIHGKEQEEEKPRDEGYLGLLIEAAQLILGDESKPDKKPPSQSTEPKIKRKNVGTNATARSGAKRKQQCWTTAAEAEWYAEYEDTSPVVKSKRGRNQVLPFKYRDSVVEPLVRWTPSTSACKPIFVESKRRSK